MYRPIKTEPGRAPGDRGPFAVLVRPHGVGSPARGREPCGRFLPIELATLFAPERHGRVPHGALAPCSGDGRDDVRLCASPGLEPVGRVPGGGGVLALRVPGDPRGPRTALSCHAVPASLPAGGPIASPGDGPTGVADASGGSAGVGNSTVGHFQIQPLDRWPCVADRSPGESSRTAGPRCGSSGSRLRYSWAPAIASPQLVLTWELTRFGGFLAGASISFPTMLSCPLPF